MAFLRAWKSVLVEIGTLLLISGVAVGIMAGIILGLVWLMGAWAAPVIVAMVILGITAVEALDQMDRRRY